MSQYQWTERAVNTSWILSASSLDSPLCSWKPALSDLLFFGVIQRQPPAPLGPTSISVAEVKEVDSVGIALLLFQLWSGFWRIRLSLPTGPVLLRVKNFACFGKYLYTPREGKQRKDIDTGIGKGPRHKHWCEKAPTIFFLSTFVNKARVCLFIPAWTEPRCNMELIVRLQVHGQTYLARHHRIKFFCKGYTVELIRFDSTSNEKKWQI